MAALLRPDRVAPLTLGQLAEGLDGVRVTHGADTVVDNMSLDSRTIAGRELYVALPGTRFHGARFAADAVGQGAVGVLTDAEGAGLAAEAGVPVVVADEPRSAMARMAARLYGNPADDMTMVGITGTNGKTTTTFLVEEALAHAGRRVATVGTMGFRLDGTSLESARTTVTTPESLDLQALLAVFRERGAEAVAMEVSSHALALQRVEPIRFDVAAFTNLGRDHLDFHQTMEAYFEAKAALFTPAASQACVVNVDTPAGRELARRVSASGGRRLLITGTAPDATYRLTSVNAQSGGSVLSVTTPTGPLVFPISMPGDYNAANAVTALAISDLLGVDRASALAGLAVAQVPGRMQRVRLGQGAPLVYVDFAHTPQAIASALGAIAVPGRVVVVFGAGGDRDAAKRAPMAKAAVQGADFVVITDDNPRTEDPSSIRRELFDAALVAQIDTATRATGIVDGGDRRAAIRSGLRLAGPDGAVAVLGKGHEQGQIVGDTIVPFDDVTVVTEEWAALGREDAR